MGEINFNYENTYSTRINVHIGYLNYSGHVGADGFLALLHEARIRYFADFGFKELDIAGKGTFIIDSYTEYKGEIFHNDEIIVEMKITDLEKTSFNIFYKGTNKKKDRLVVLCRMKMAFVDRETHRPARIPEAFRKTFSD